MRQCWNGDKDCLKYIARSGLHLDYAGIKNGNDFTLHRLQKLPSHDE